MAAFQTPFTDKYGAKLSSTEFAVKVSARIRAVMEEFSVWIMNTAGVVPSHSFRKAVYGLGGIGLGEGSVIHTGAVFYTIGNIRIADDSIIGEKAILDGRGGLEIGSHVDIASEVMIYTSQHDINDPGFKPVHAKVFVEDYVFIGPRAIILPGVTLGRGSVVAAGAVVTKSVEPYSVVAGVPAKKIAERRLQDLHYRLGRARLFR